MALRIGINGLLLHPTRVGGAETYARALLRYLPIVAPEHRYIVFTTQDSDFVSEHANIEVVRRSAPSLNPYGRVLYEQLILPRVLASHKLDLLHCVGTTIPASYRGKTIVTIHETLRFQAPSHSLLGMHHYYSWNHKRVVRNKCHVIAVSESDAAVMRRNLHIASSRLHVIHLAVNERFLTLNPALSGHEKSYLLWVGRCYPHKNLESLLEGYSIVRQRLPSAPPLRLVGVRPEDRIRLQGLMGRFGIDKQVILDGPIPHDELPDVYRKAIALCIPSRVESFGLPLIEAMACGTAVVCSDLPAFHELFGDNVIYFPVEEPTACADSLCRVLQDDALRKSLETNGPTIAAKFSWQECARLTAECYLQAIGDNSTG